MTADFATVLPEIILAVGAMALLRLGSYGGGDRKAQLIHWVSAALMAALGLWIAVNGAGVTAAFGGSFVDDAYARFAKVLILLSAALMLILGEDYLTRHGMMKFEFPILILLAANNGSFTEGITVMNSVIKKLIIIHVSDPAWMLKHHSEDVIIIVQVPE